MDAQLTTSNPEAQKAGDVSKSETTGISADAAIGTPVDDPSNMQKRDEVLDSIGRNGLVVVIGAGVSLQSVGHPGQSTDVAGWPGLLTHGVEHCLKHQLLVADEANLVREQIRIGTNNGKTDYLIEAAQRIHDSLDKRTNGRYWWLHDSIGQLTVKEPRLIRAIQGMGGLVTTLNYDSLVEDVTEWRPIEWHQRTEVTRCMHDRERDVVLHLHGFWKNPDSIILDRLSYEKISVHEDTRDLLRDFSRNYTLLFVGCGDTFFDPNFQTLLRWARDALQGVQHRHYILCRQSDEPGLFNSLQEHGYLDTLVYGDSYDSLSPFLEEIGKESGTSSEATNPPLVPVTGLKADSISKPLKPFDIWKLQTQR
ncbi:SIR2 family NAD-dependent protein deacylase [Rubritalea sp.]|uniref:SIR2 family NAD-dependent protein deacylase n=1 Tax=Rubritalea sp. TaxID=2109375 RepID=UPI003EFA55A2